jgi:Cof subfamily protein (haloacid dehalogenase superfamily)
MMQVEPDNQMRAGHQRPERISLLIADVDGTLVTHDKVLTPRAQAAVHTLAERGIRVALTSGRPPKGMKMLFEPLRIETPVAGFNGGMFARADLSIIEERLLSGEVARQAAELILKQGLDLWVYSGEDWLVRDDGAPHVAREQWTVKFPPKVTTSFDSALSSAVKLVGVSDDLERVAGAELEAQRVLGDSASAQRSQPYYLDVTHPSANKGFVVQYLSEHLAVSVDEIATIGDMPNDTLMFARSGLAIAMGHSSNEVKQKADLVTTSSGEEGFANAVERFILAGEGDL